MHVRQPTGPSLTFFIIQAGFCSPLVTDQVCSSSCRSVGLSWEERGRDNFYFTETTFCRDFFTCALQCNNVSLSAIACNNNMSCLCSAVRYALTVFNYLAVEHSNAARLCLPASSPCVVLFDHPEQVHPVKAGEEVFSSFGKISNAQLLNSYGFILPG